MSREKVLEVKNLSVSFRTLNGMVRAVRDVSFDLYKGETLAIVGESGSGKSVTNRAIMGILAGNSIIDDGEILYRNQDLTKISESNMHEIRGSRIGMIYQDPLSSLNPTMTVGKQITEAILVNGNRIKRKFSDMYHYEYNDYRNKLTEIRLLEDDIASKKFELNVNEDLKRKEKREQFKKYKAEKQALISQHKLALPELKEKYQTSKKAARVEINKYVADLKEKHKVELKDLQDKLKVADGDAKVEIRKQIDDLKFEYESNFKVSKKEAYDEAIKIMEEVGIPEPTKRFKQYPFQFSGGMRQRIVIAIALIANPHVLICDEPTTALDVTIQGQILDLIKDIKKRRDLSVIFITHDLGVVANIADRVAVMYAGKILEYGTAEEVFYDPKHPYTWALLSSVPDLETTEKLLSIPGVPPDMLYPPKGDAFAERNEHALKIDFMEHPPFFKVSDTHYAATWLLHENAPKVERPRIIDERCIQYKELIKKNQEKGLM